MPWNQPGKKKGEVFSSCSICGLPHQANVCCNCGAPIAKGLLVVAFGLEPNKSKEGHSYRALRIDVKRRIPRCCGEKRIACGLCTGFRFLKTKGAEEARVHSFCSEEDLPFLKKDLWYFVLVNRIAEIVYRDAGLTPMPRDASGILGLDFAENIEVFAEGIIAKNDDVISDYLGNIWHRYLQQNGCESKRPKEVVFPVFPIVFDLIYPILLRDFVVKHRPPHLQGNYDHYDVGFNPDGQITLGGRPLSGLYNNLSPSEFMKALSIATDFHPYH